MARGSESKPGPDRKVKMNLQAPGISVRYGKKTLKHGTTHSVDEEFAEDLIAAGRAKPA